MQQTISAVQWVFGLALLPYALAVVMPTWRWLLGCAIVIGGPLTAIWLQHWIVSQRPGYDEGVGGAIGVAIFFGITLGVASGVLVRAATLGLSARGWSGAWASALNVAGLFLAIGIVVSPEAMRESAASRAVGGVRKVRLQTRCRGRASFPAGHAVAQRLSRTLVADGRLLSPEQRQHPRLVRGDGERHAAHARDQDLAPHRGERICSGG